MKTIEISSKPLVATYGENVLKEIQSKGKLRSRNGELIIRIPAKALLEILDDYDL
jgi:hypothetical protein